MVEYPFKADITLSEGTYIDNGSLDGARIDQYRRASSALSEIVNSAVVYASGSSSRYSKQNFPVLFQTQGMGKKKAYENYDNNIKQYLLGKPKQVSVIGKTNCGTDERVGEFGVPFFLYFRDRHFTKGEIILRGTLSRNYQVQLLTGGEAEAGLVKYKAKIFGQEHSFVPGSEFAAGSIWADGLYKVSQEDSSGNEHRTYTPYAVFNTLTTVRQSMNVKGNSANKTMNYTINIDGKSFKMFYEWEKYQTDLKWNYLKEQDLLTSKATKTRLNPEVSNFDVTSNKPVLSGNGLVGQTPSCNFMNYTYMTVKRLDTFLTDSLEVAGNLSDSHDNMVIDVMGGWDFLNNVQDAMKRSSSLEATSVPADTFVQKTANGLQYGGYFTAYKHISGAVFRFTHHSFFDSSGLAMSAPKNPITTRSIMSSEAIIMNFGKVTYDAGDGKGSVEANNVEYMYEKGREYIDGTVRGMAMIDGKQGGDIATDIDSSSRQMMCTQGIHNYAPLSMAYIQYNYR